MRSIKMLISAALLAVAATAMIGAGSASAAVICDTAPEGTPATCPVGHQVPNETMLQSSDAIVTFKNMYGGDIVCQHSHMNLRVKSGGFAITMTQPWELSQCETKNSIHHGTCEFHPEYNWRLQFYYDTQGTPLGEAGVAEDISWTCSSFVNCTFWTTGNGHLPATTSPLGITFSELKLVAHPESSRSICGEGTTMSTTQYTFSKEGKPVYLATQ